MTNVRDAGLRAHSATCQQQASDQDQLDRYVEEAPVFHLQPPVQSEFEFESSIAAARLLRLIMC